ncbi:MAG: DUF2817 domain-containing protein, partial [Bacteroidales bacterium]|nr:DUF2817 domain-containing protein [Bacteroidales bacterium]
MRTFRDWFVSLGITVFLGLFFINSVFSQTDGEKKQWLSYFDDSYVECRTDFMIRADGLKSKFDKVQIIRVKVPSKIDDKLFVDLCYIPAHNSTKRLLILSSGIHGIEGYVGNAVTDLFMDDFINDDLLKETGVLLIHAMNPYGFKYMRRVTENNVDLNRNSDINPELYETVNAGYSDLIEFLNPTEPVRAGSMKNRFFFVTAIRKIMQASLPVLRQAVLQGQYKYTDGLYFGGKEQEPQITAVGKVIKNIGKEYNMILNIDLHTGYGER